MTNKQTKQTKQTEQEEKFAHLFDFAYFLRDHKGGIRNAVSLLREFIEIKYPEEMKRVQSKKEIKRKR